MELRLLGILVAHWLLICYLGMALTTERHKVAAYEKGMKIKMEWLRDTVGK